MIYKHHNHYEYVLVLGNLMMISCLWSIVDISWMLYIHFLCFEHVLGSFVMRKSEQYWCNRIVFNVTSAIDISDNNGFLNMIYRLCRLSTFVVSCLLEPFLPFKNERDLVRNFCPQTFPSFDASSASFSMIPPWSN